jgi:hypothetical protein
MEVTHINHASLLVKNRDGNYIWTDPWVLSNAFGAWVQSPSPHADLIFEIAKLPATRLSLLVSHGHDDHFDEFVMSSPTFQNLSILIPKLSSQGLRKRVEKQLGAGRPVHEVSDSPILHNGFEIMRLVNSEFTGQDAIFLVFADEVCLIHANDNWHRYPRYILEQINAFLRTRNCKQIVFAVQFGIADAFPDSYSGYSDQERLSLAQARLRTSSQAILANMHALPVDKAFLYANQYSAVSSSQFNAENPDTRRDESDANVWLSSGNTAQLKSGDVISFDGQGALQLRRFEDTSSKNAKSIFESSLKSLEKSAVTFVKARVSDRRLQEFSFQTYGKDPITPIVLEASQRVWQNILTGKETIETIIIGGDGVIRKPKNLNISELHVLFSNWSYRVQAEIRLIGVDWFLAAS